MLNEIQRKAKDEATMFFRGFTASATGPNTRNIVGWGIGARVIDELVRPDENVLRVYVRELPAPAVPQQFGDLPTEAVEVGKITAYQSGEQYPVPCGVSIGSR